VAVYNGGGWDITLKVLDPIYPSGFGGDVEALSKQVRGVGFRVSGQGLRVQGSGFGALSKQVRGGDGLRCVVY